MPDSPPELVAILRLASAITGECSVCHEVIVVRGVGTDTLEEQVRLLRDAFLKHVRRNHPAGGQLAE
jgi:hypothetical protein